jgi:hypothetical protein
MSEQETSTTNVAPATPVSEQVVATAPVVKAIDLSGRCAICHKPLTKGDVGATCTAHMGKIRAGAIISDSVPDGWVRMSKVCRYLEAAGFTTSAIVKACGGDAATEAPIAEIFRVHYVGRGKWLHPDCMTSKGVDAMKTAAKAEVKPPAPVQPAKVEAVISEIAATLARSPNAGMDNGKKKQVVKK